MFTLIPLSKLFFYDVNSWQVNIYEMMRTILSISTENMDAYFDTIDSRLFFYENLLSILYVVARTIWLRIWHCSGYFVISLTDEDGGKDVLNDKDGNQI